MIKGKAEVFFGNQTVGVSYGIDLIFTAESRLGWKLETIESWLKCRAKENLDG